MLASDISKTIHVFKIVTDIRFIVVFGVAVISVRGLLSLHFMALTLLLLIAFLLVCTAC